jgi:uncharacterized protein YpmS
MPLIKNFRSTSIWKAFFLNSILSAIVILIALTVKSKFDNYRLKNNHKNTKNDDTIDRTTNSTSVLLTLLFTFIASFASYTLMYLIFGFGSAMVAD